jgi:hypothetical protein
MIAMRACYATKSRTPEDRANFHILSRVRVFFSFFLPLLLLIVL